MTTLNPTDYMTVLCEDRDGIETLVKWEAPATQSNKAIRDEVQAASKMRAIKIIDRHGPMQTYKGIQFARTMNASKRRDFRQAYQFILAGSKHTFWIPKKHLDASGHLLPNQNIDYVFRPIPTPLEKAGYTGPIPGIKRANILKK